MQSLTVDMFTVGILPSQVRQPNDALQDALDSFYMFVICLPQISAFDDNALCTTPTAAVVLQSPMNPTRLAVYLLPGIGIASSSAGKTTMATQ